MAEFNTKVLIIGSGPAGYTAGIYAARAGLNPVLVAGPQIGGQLTITTDVENFPGFPQPVNGGELMLKMKEQAEKIGVRIVEDTITEIDLSKPPFYCSSENSHVFTGQTIIISTGASARWLGLKNEEKFRGFGVSACATCDGFFYRNRDVAVVGGGDTACEEALYLSSLCRKVYMIVRKDYLRASSVMRSRVEARDNIEILYRCNTAGLFGEDGLEGAHLVKDKGTDHEEFFDIAIEGFFLAIGHRPNTSVFEGKLELDEAGYIVTKAPYTATSIEGVFAAGDCADPIYRQAITSAGTGCRAALDAERFLIDHNEL